MNGQGDLFAYPKRPGWKGGTNTSKRAAREIEPQQTSLQKLVLQAIKASVDGLTADEVAGKLGRSELAIRPRLSELKKLGEIAPIGATRRNASGKMADVLIDKARAK